MNPTALEKQSIQEHEPPTSLGSPDWYYSLPSSNPNDDVLLSDWGAHARDRELRELYRNQYAWLAQSAVAALVRKVAQTPWQLKGGRNLTTYFQGVLQDADFNDGWSQFWARVLLDYSTCDYGAYIEIIGGGRADKPLKGRVQGIAHLDSLRCIPTGNLEFPVVYWSRRSGKMYRIHRTRIYRLVDMPDGDESHFGVGLCALSRAISIMQQQLSLMKYTNAMLDDVPANGMLFLPAGLSSQTFNDMMAEYKMRREHQGYKGPIALGTSSSEGVKAEYLSFAMAPDGFDYATYIDIAVNAFAATFGIDRQDIFPLQGKMAGTATQSEIMFEKAKGMAFGNLLSLIKRMFNTSILPPSLEFDFEYRDEEKDKQVADRTTVLLNNGNLLRGLGATDEVVMNYLAQQDETLRDILLNENGEIIALPDDDVLDNSQTEDLEVIETDNGTETEDDANIEDGDGNKALGLGAFAHIPVSNNKFIVGTQRILQEKLSADNIIEWQTFPTLHITMVYADYLNDSALKQLRDTFVIPQTMPFDAYKYRTFETPNGYALHLVVEPSREMLDVQERLWLEFKKLGDGISEFSKPENWQPHITLAYLKEDIEWQDIEYMPYISGEADTVVISRGDNYLPALTLTSAKEITDTQTAFMERFDAVYKEARAGNINRRRAGILIRGMIRTFGGRAFADGLEVGGVPRDELSQSDSSTISQLVTRNSQYVSNLTDVIYHGEGVTDAQADSKAFMWFNKTINPFYDAGRASADANGMYRWVLGATEEHCPDCSYMNGQIHRLKSYLDSGVHPKSSKLECKGFRCECELVREENARASGRILKKSLHIHHDHHHTIKVA